jgi:hypothetical protein
MGSPEDMWSPPDMALDDVCPVESLVWARLEPARARPRAAPAAKVASVVFMGIVLSKGGRDTRPVHPACGIGGPASRR